MKQEPKVQPGCERSLYASPAYAMAFGQPVLKIPEWKTSVLKRSIPGSEWEDALGCYPLCLIERQADLEGGLQRLRRAGLVSISLVPDPVTGPSSEALHAAFSVCRPFKSHYLIDGAAGPLRFAASHRRWMRKASRECDVKQERLQDSLGDWERLYRKTVERHAIDGLQKFSSAYFAALANMPAVEAFSARVEGAIVAMALWVCSPEVIYYHLGASDSRGYAAQAMYGIFALVLERFAESRVIHLGGAAGVSPAEVDGLARFKRGFANREVQAYFCGACLDPERYGALARDRSANAFFPAYRTYD